MYTFSRCVAQISVHYKLYFVLDDKEVKAKGKAIIPKRLFCYFLLDKLRSDVLPITHHEIEAS